jgi:hypothetical protein
MSDSISVMVRVAPDLHAWLCQRAKRNHIGVATVVRQLLLNAKEADETGRGGL